MLLVYPKHEGALGLVCPARAWPDFGQRALLPEVRRNTTKAKGILAMERFGPWTQNQY